MRKGLLHQFLLTKEHAEWAENRKEESTVENKARGNKSESESKSEKDNWNQTTRTQANSIEFARLHDMVSTARKQKKRWVRIGFSSSGKLFSYVTYIEPLD